MIKIFQPTNPSVLQRGAHGPFSRHAMPYRLYLAGVYYAEPGPARMRMFRSPWWYAGRPALSPVGGPQTVEQIVAAGYFAVPRADPVTALIADGEHTSRLGLDDVIAQLRQRYDIWQQNVADIEQSKLAAVNAMHDWEAYYGRPGVELRAALHSTLQRLYQQERDERSSLWRDLARVRQLVPEWARQYLAAYRKVNLLQHDGGDGP